MHQEHKHLIEKYIDYYNDKKVDEHVISVPPGNR